uniref:Uncharacterized protein n=1 Tax=Podoviridae sp. ctxqo3 TaxID=2827755 RepID=A0A8S5SZC9_9CAUD|nr:MAG TPA: hypothetical protein [Podoviridae sp. ctxqo3]
MLVLFMPYYSIDYKLCLELCPKFLTNRKNCDSKSLLFLYI